MTIMYGIDIDQPITPLMVRDALIECFYEAHCQDTGFESPDEGGNRLYCSALIKKAFADTHGNFDNPTKEELVRVVEHLVEFSKNFRDPSIIQAHAQDMQKLLDKVQ